MALSETVLNLYNELPKQTWLDTSEWSLRVIPSPMALCR